MTNLIKLPPDVTLQRVFPIRDSFLCDNMKGFSELREELNNNMNQGSDVIEDIGISYEELVTIKTKELNGLLKNVPKGRRQDIKSIRRTLKNRGYAANSRIRQFSEKERLQMNIQDMMREIEDKKNMMNQNRQKIIKIIEYCNELLHTLDFYEHGLQIKERIKETVIRENPLMEEEMREVFEQLGKTKMQLNI